jgi:hypothetical protein
MKYVHSAVLSGFFVLAASNAQAVGRLADVSIIDRDSGEVLTTHYFRGEYWVAGRPGARYAIAVRNQRGERLLAVAAVDGVNVVSGDTASWAQTGYVFAPWQSYEITGWRKSDAEIAAFEFTSAPDAYATRTGRAANLGVVGVALFRERPVAPVAVVAPMAVEPDSDFRLRSEQSAASASAPAADGAASGSLERSARRSLSTDKLGTGHGGREHSEVTATEFERLHERPDEVIRIRYDSLHNLLAMGVIRQPRSEWPTPDPFPQSPMVRYVPDPPSFR